MIGSCSRVLLYSVVIYLVSKHFCAGATELEAAGEPDTKSDAKREGPVRETPGQQRVSLLLTESKDFRGGLGNILSGIVDAVAPGSCVGDVLNFGYTSTKHGEDDYGFMPLCKSPSEANTISCFPGIASVVTPDGARWMSEITVGTEVAVGWKAGTNLLHFERVLFFLHRQPNVASMSGLVKLLWRTTRRPVDEAGVGAATWNSSSPWASNDEVGSITLWPEHLLFLCPKSGPLTTESCTDAKKASDVRVGDRVVVVVNDESGNRNPQLANVVETRKVGSSAFSSQTPRNPVARANHDNRLLMEKASSMLNSNNRAADVTSSSGEVSPFTGAYAPITSSGTILVDGTWTSQYSSMPSNFVDFLGFMENSHRAAHLLTWPLRQAALRMPFLNLSTTARLVELLLQALQPLYEYGSSLRRMGYTLGTKYYYSGISAYRSKAILLAAM